ncbi:MAG TPA: ATP-binding protein [Trichocoleus sp.]
MKQLLKGIERQPQEHSSRKLRLQAVYTAVVVIPFVIQIIVAVGLISALSLRSGRSAVNEVTTRLSDEVAHRIYDQLKNYLEVPHLINQLNTRAARLGAVDFNDTRALELRFWNQIQLYDSLSSIGFGSRDGRYVAGDRRGALFRLGHRDAQSPEGKLHMYETDELGNPTRLSYTGKANYDPRVRPWYKLGEQSLEGRWTDIFTYSAQPTFVISAVRAIQDENGQFQGVVITDLILSDINAFLRSLEIGTTGETFILERSGNLIATSTPTSPFRIVDGTPQRVQAVDADSPLIRAAAQHLVSKFGDLSSIQSMQQLSFSLDGEQTFLQVMPYVDPRGLDWLIAVVVPEDDFTGPIYANQQFLVGVGLLIMLIAIGVGLITARWLVRPITGLAAAAAAVADGNWDGTVAVERDIERDDEIGLLANAFNRVAGQLQHSLAALSEREARLAEAQSVARLGSWEYDLQEKRLTCSDELFRLYGLEPTAENPTAYLEEIRSYQRIHPDDREQVKAVIRQAAADGQPYEIDHRILRADGQVRYVQTRGRALLDESGQAKALFGTQMDITERKAAEAERKRLLEAEQAARQEAEMANQAKDQFLAILSHELRNPLNPILGWSRLLRTNKLNAQKTAQALETIERNANLQVQIIEDILDVSRILRGKLSLTLRPVNLAEVITAAVETVQFLALEKSIAIHTHIGSMGVQVEGDFNRLQQVMTNLLSNAIKFTPQGGRVDVHLEQVERREVAQEDVTQWGSRQVEESVLQISIPPHAYAKVTVSDTGKGIEPEVLPYIFEHFRQADSTTTREFGGLGLGLAIVRHLTEMHGGSISAASDGLNQGSVFTLLLPASVRSPEAKSTEPAANLAELAGLRILVVDDSPDNLDFLAIFLRESGAVVTAVTSGEDALKAAAAEPFDLLLSDIAMPDMDGYELMRQVRQMTSAPVNTAVAIALTAHAGTAAQQQALAAGFDAHLAKPIDSKHLRQTILELMQQRHSTV